METTAMLARPDAGGFNENEWIRLLFLISDTEQWLDDLSRRLFHQIPVEDRKRLFRRTYYLTASALTHILERHYHKIQRHPQTGKFTIPVALILHYLRQAAEATPEPIPGSVHHKRIWEAAEPVGFDRDGKITALITVLTDAGGKIVTAFPGLME